MIAGVSIQDFGPDYYIITWHCLAYDPFLARVQVIGFEEEENNISIRKKFFANYEVEQFLIEEQLHMQ